VKFSQSLGRKPWGVAWFRGNAETLAIKVRAFALFELAQSASVTIVTIERGAVL
jgi:hypothetical protein